MRELRSFEENVRNEKQERGVHEIMNGLNKISEGYM